MDDKLMKKMSEDASRMTPKLSQNITRDKIRNLLPKGSQIALTDDLMSMIGTMGDDIDLPQELLEEDLMSYTYLLGQQKGSPRFEDLINAIKFCNLKRNHNTEVSWSIVFPERHAKLTAEKRKISSHVSMYNQTNLVRAIDKEMLIPAHLQYAPYFHAAVKKQFDLMNGKAGATNADGEDMTVTPMVMHLAAKELALITKQPEEAKIDLKITQSDAMLNAQHEMNTQLENIVANQAKAFAAGGDVAQLQRVHVNIEEVTEAEIDE